MKRFAPSAAPLIQDAWGYNGEGGAEGGHERVVDEGGDARVLIELMQRVLGKHRLEHAMLKRERRLCAVVAPIAAGCECCSLS